MEFIFERTAGLLNTYKVNLWKNSQYRLSSYFTNDGKMTPALENDEIDPDEDAIEGLNETPSENRGRNSLASHHRSPDRR